jgi:formylglycine-generating enzyme required for sulfatase activity
LPTPTFGLSLIANNKLYVIGGDDESNGIGNEVITDKVWSLVIAEPSPSLTPVTVIPAAAGTPPSFTGTVTGGYPYGTAWLQASVDLGVADPWANIASMALDNLGSATFTNIPDPRPQAATAQRDFFRVSTTADRYTPPTPDGFALIPAGSFQMGDQSNPLVGLGGELPVHSVSVSAFYMGKYEVTKELWDAVRAWGLTNGYTDLPVGNGSFASKGANHPVHSITWYDMVKWCNARSQKEGLTPCYTVSGATYKTGQSAPVCNWSENGYRLPTEAEWEKAARGGVAGKNFPWGTDTITHSQANYNVISSNGTTNDYNYDLTPRPGYLIEYYYHPTYAVGGEPYSSPVGSFAPNGYGLYDMAGNKWEWCWDWYGSYAAGSQTDPSGPSSGSNRVRRGGSWYTSASSCRTAFRVSSNPTGTISYIGFRIARSSVP